MYAKRGGMNSHKSVLLFLGSCFLYGVSLSTDQASICASLPLESGSLCQMGRASADRPILMPLVQMPDEARIVKCQQAIAEQLHKNARTRLLVRGATLLGVCAICSSFFAPTKKMAGDLVNAVRRRFSGVKVDEPLPQCKLDQKKIQETIEYTYKELNAPWWHKVFEVMGYSSLGFFVTQQLERASDALAISLFYPVTLRWFIEHSHPIIVARTTFLEAKSAQEGAQEVTITRSPYLEEIERFVSVCSDPKALSGQAHDTQTYCVITGINSFIDQLEKVLGFIGYQQQHAAPAAADQIAVTLAALYASAQHFCVSVQEILQSSGPSLTDKKRSMVILLRDMKAELSRFIVDRLYRLESEE